MTVFFDVVDEIKSITEIISSAFYFFNAVPRKFLFYFFWKIVDYMCGFLLAVMF